LGRLLPSLLILILTTTFASAQNRSLVQFGRTIRVEAGQPVGEVTCIMCSVYLRAPVMGDVTTIGGSINLDTGVSVGGDVTALAGDIRTQSGVSIGGDATAIGGAIRRQSDTQIGGDATSMEGKGWLLLIFVVPLIILGLIVALIAWLVRYLLRSPTGPPQMGSSFEQRSTRP
jgi:hypothetical protein